MRESLEKGAVFFVLGMGMLMISSSVFSIVLIIPFLVKVPTFPFYYWLPEAHAEANTSISLFLAAVVLKLGMFALVRFFGKALLSKPNSKVCGTEVGEVCIS